jgi:hypothetical protein
MSKLPSFRKSQRKNQFKTELFVNLMINLQVIMEKIISGGQTGADIGGILAAKQLGIPTGGTLPKGWRTLEGPHPEYAELYQMTEHESPNYPPRTYQNVKDSDGTIRIAQKIDSAGEKMTLEAIIKYGKPHFDVHVDDPHQLTISEQYGPQVAADWIIRNNIKVLNVAGNSEQTAPGIQEFAKSYIGAVIKILQSK